MTDSEALNKLRDMLQLIFQHRGKGRIVSFTDEDIEAVSRGINVLEKCIELEEIHREEK